MVERESREEYKGEWVGGGGGGVKKRNRVNQLLLFPELKLIAEKEGEGKERKGT